MKQKTDKALKIHASVKNTGGRPSKHPWDQIEALYVHGEDVEKPGKSGSLETYREWPTQSDLAKRFHLRLDQVSRRFCTVGPNGETTNDRQAAFRTDYLRRVDAELMMVLVGREIRFRIATMALAELSLGQIALLISRTQNADGLAKLMIAAKRAQEVGMVALDRPANGSEGGEDLGIEDWSLMREVHRGTRSVPAAYPESR